MSTPARFAKLGIKPGARFSLDGSSPEVRQAIADGVAAAQKAILDYESKSKRPGNTVLTQSINAAWSWAAGG